MAPKTASEEIKNFYTWGSFLSLSVAAGAVWTVAGTLSHAFDWEYPKYFPFLLAFVFSVAGDFAAKNRGMFVKRAMLWFLNACLIYTTAIGGTEIAAGSSQRKQEKLQAQTEQLSETTDKLVSLAEPISSSDVRALQSEIVLLRGCLQREASADCAEEHSISPWITPVYRLYSAHATRTGPIQNLTRQFASSAQTLDKELRTTTGEVGFKRISAVFH